MKKPYIIAIVGKGGVGKSVITALMAKSLTKTYNFKLLLIDADPAYPHLSLMVDLKPVKTLEMIRNEIIEKTLKNDKNIKKIAENVDFYVYNAIQESKSFSLLSIGQPEDEGCFCPSNTLLKRVIEAISVDFEVILIDCEAGLEQISRKVIENIDYLLIVTDISIRSIETAYAISKISKKYTNTKNVGVIVNKEEGEIEQIKERLKYYDLNLIGTIPKDSKITNLDMNAEPIINITENSGSYQNIELILGKIFDN